MMLLAMPGSAEVDWGRYRLYYRSMSKLRTWLVLALAVVIHGTALASSAQVDPAVNLLGPPSADGPAVVRAAFELRDINEINDEAETFEIVGVLTLVWKDPRQAFSATDDGVAERIFQGNYQFNEISPGWFPQVVIVNDGGQVTTSGVLLRVRSDGTSTLVATLTAVAKAEFDMTRYPYDRHRLEVLIEILGFGSDEVAFEVDPTRDDIPPPVVTVPQWTISSAELSVRERPSSTAGTKGVASTFVVAVTATRQPFYIHRLVVFPLVVIVLLSFSVFWMDRSSLGDRISVSFIGILTGVAYQMVMSQNLPRISYVTLMHAFLSVSFLTMSATVVINLVVGMLDKRKKYELGNRIDRRCRWIFPTAYAGVVGLVSWIAFQM